MKASELRAKDVAGLEKEVGDLEDKSAALTQRWKQEKAKLDAIAALELPADLFAGVSPRLPTDGSMPASARRSLYRIDTYWLPRSE